MVWPYNNLVRVVFSNATRIESQQFILRIKEVGQLLFLKRGGFFYLFSQPRKESN
jgi:hypothetical protein